MDHSSCAKNLPNGLNNDPNSVGIASVLRLFCGGANLRVSLPLHDCVNPPCGGRFVVAPA